MNPIIKNGFCVKHNIFWQCCDNCLKEFQNEENKKWLEKQKAIKESYQYWNSIGKLNNRITEN